MGKEKKKKEKMAICKRAGEGGKELCLTYSKSSIFYAKTEVNNQ